METSFTEIQIDFLKSKGFTKKSDNIFEYCENDRFSKTELVFRDGQYFIENEYFYYDEDDDCYDLIDYAQFENSEDQSLEEFVNEHY